MISCLQNYIGAIDIATNPTSGRFVNELAGITTQRIEETNEQEDIYEISDAWSEIESVAIKKFEQRLYSWAKKYMMQYSILGTSITGQYRDKVLVPQSNEFIGVLFDYDYQTRKAQSVHVERVNLWSESAVDTTIRAYNAATGELLQAKDVSLLAGDNSIILSWEFPTWRYSQVFVCYDNSEVQTIEHDSYDFSALNALLFKRVSKGSNVLNGNLVSSGQQNGLIVTYNIKCSLDNFVCQRLHLFQEPYMYFLGAEILNQSIHSEEINRYTLIDYENAKELQIEYTKMANDMMSDALDGLSIEEDPYCFICNRAINHRVMLP